MKVDTSLQGTAPSAWTDKTTAEGWMQKSNFVMRGEDPIQATAQVGTGGARKYASIFIEADIYIKGYSRWFPFPGNSNNVIDVLLKISLIWLDLLDTAAFHEQAWYRSNT